MIAIISQVTTSVNSVWKSIMKRIARTEGCEIMLRDARGRIQGSYQNGKFDQKPIAGKDLTLGIDVNYRHWVSDSCRVKSVVS